MITEESTNSQEEGNNGVAPTTDNNGEGASGGENNAGGAGEGNPAGEQQAVNVAVEPDEESIRRFFASKGRAVEKLDDLFVEKEKIVEVNPYADVLEDVEAKSFLDFKKETGRGLSDYLKLQENINDIPVKDLAIAKAKAELGSNLSREDLITYIEEVTGVDIDGIDELTSLETAKVNKFVKDYKDNLLAEQEKYKTPIAKQTPAAEEIEMVTLENGEKISKKVYEDHQIKRQAYLEDIRVSVDSVAKTSLSMEIDNAGQKEVLTFDYEYDADDKKGMISLTADLDQTVTNLFRTEKGFDHQAFAEAVWRLDPKNWEKQVAAIAQKARAAGIEEVTKVGNNVNLEQNLLPNGGVSKPGVKIVPVKELLNR